ncbi:response regulator transcription factor [Pseudomonas sp. CFBP 13602]|uniref:response regulator transcription factor n=1 Tax=Pseudomonas sp. CFBP 13602 TaxID=2774039 RepID=UPI001786AD66|nr:response regulator transcription factor [Pseudomonas sp. CFBP 13602]MBD8824892.1 response regulator transcription factor [Pseudomonas sp. CFBP 13602]
MRKALIVDDHPFIRASVRTLLAQELQYQVIESGNSTDGVRLYRDERPDLVILDLSMPGLDGFDVLRRMRESTSPGKIIVLTSMPPGYYSMRSMKAGATAFVSKSDALDQLRKAIAAVQSGYTYFPDCTDVSLGRVDSDSTEAARISSLTDREILVLVNLAKGLCNQDIAHTMLLSHKTVSTYKMRMMRKLRLNSVMEMTDLARRHELI